MLALVAAFFLWSGKRVPQLPKASQFVDLRSVEQSRRAACGSPRTDGRPVVIEMLYSNDKEEWIDAAASRFARLCPNIQVRTTPLDAVDAADAILSGEASPTIWSPANDLMIRYVEERWRDRRGSAPFDVRQQVSLVRSPLVVLIWEDRLAVLESILAQRRNGEGPWFEGMCAGVPRDPQGLDRMTLADMVPGTWIDWYNPAAPPSPTTPRWAARKADKKTRPAAYVPMFPTPEQIRQWGRVKLVHSSPTQSEAGLAALYLMAYDYVLPPRERPAALQAQIDAALAQPVKEATIVRGDAAAADFAKAFRERREPLGRWLRRCEAGLPPAIDSSLLLTDEMFDVGPVRYDGVVTQEHLVFHLFGQISQHEDAMTELRVIYPNPTVLNEHPVVVLDDGRVSTEQREAAEKWIAFLRDAEMQKLAMTFGFRPATPGFTLRGFEDARNPFMKFRRYGIEIDSPFIEPPRISGEIVHELIRTWQDATGTN
ncbi:MULTISPECIES: substrate-binding domain-containing protein [Sorangium]|uniref:substrate-binding domain-containing protein n=1 Tax=Sorangium TaxID=39643 RepID=UPI003D9C3112